MEKESKGDVSVSVSVARCEKCCFVLVGFLLWVLDSPKNSTTTILGPCFFHVTERGGLHAVCVTTTPHYSRFPRWSPRAPRAALGSPAACLLMEGGEGTGSENATRKEKKTSAMTKKGASSGSLDVNSQGVVFVLDILQRLLLALVPAREQRQERGGHTHVSTWKVVAHCYWARCLSLSLERGGRLKRCPQAKNARCKVSRRTHSAKMTYCVEDISSILTSSLSAAAAIARAPSSSSDYTHTRTHTAQSKCVKAVESEEG